MVKCYSGYAYIATGISLGIGGALTSRWYIWQNQPVPLWADVTDGVIASAISGYGLYQLKTGKGCKTYKALKKRQKQGWINRSPKNAVLAALAIGIPIGLILYGSRIYG